MFGKKIKTAWLTRNQLEILESIRAKGRRGVSIWEKGINLSTIRSLSKRGMLDTRKGGRVIVTRLGKRRLRQPWPAVQSTGDQKDRPDMMGSGSGETSSAASDEASHGESALNQGL